MQCWHAVCVVVEDAVKGSIHAIVDVVHDSLFIGPLVLLCRRIIISLLQLLPNPVPDSKFLPSEAESSSTITFLAMMLTTSV